MCQAMTSDHVMTARHSLSHILANAVKNVCPEVKLGIGPAIEEGFYYDFLFPENFQLSPEAVEKVEKEMRKLLKQPIVFEKGQLSIPEARQFFQNEPFKLELIGDLEQAGESAVGTYKSGEFVDLCRGPHVPSTTELRPVAWKIDRISGAYWKGSEKNPMLQRIYVLAYATEDELKAYIEAREEAARRDHRKLGAELELFTTSDLIGRGLPLLLPKGATIRRVIERFIVDEELKRGYLHVSTPHMARKKIYEISGHWELYKEGMYPPMDLGGGEEVVLRPMTCPHHFMVYKDRPRSYRELPMRIAEIASQFRRELSGELTGLMRIMTFTLADAHIVCTPDQVEQEFRGAVELLRYVSRCLGIESALSFRASLRDDNKEKYVDNPELWERGQGALLRILDELGLEYTKSPGHAAFYGPKLDVQMRNVLGKEETIITVQIDFCMPDRFDMTYIDANGQKVRPVVIHRSSIGCIERTIGFLTEFYAGSFPLWLAPIQARVLTITDEQIPYAKEIEAALHEANLRVESDLRPEKISKKLVEARHQRIPYLLITGKKEAAAGQVTVRNRDTGEQSTIGLADFVERARGEVAAFATRLGI